MNGVEELPGWAALFTSILLLVGAAITLIGSLGLVRLDSFYKRVHAPTLGTTLGTASIALASIVYFSAVQTGLVLHAILIVVFVIGTTPITLTILVRAALFRDRSESSDGSLGKDGRVHLIGATDSAQ
jgi:multicomponent K+:H+ antiporter subunit G